MKILFVSADEYPVFGTTVNIMKKLFFEGGLAEKIDKIGVLSFDKSLDGNYESIHKNIHIHKVLNYANFNSAEMKNYFRNRQIFTSIKIFFSKSFVKLFGYRTKDGFVRKDNVSLLKKKIIEVSKEYDTIVAVFGNYDAAFAVAEALPKCNVKLVLYQVDPCSTNWIVPKRQICEMERFEKRLYSMADMIFTMPVIYNEVVKLCYKCDVHKFHKQDLPLVVNKCGLDNREHGEKTICVFSGLIYAGIRNPQYTLALFSELVKTSTVELWLIGVEKNELPIEFQALPIRCLGRVSIKEADEYMNQADILVNIGNLMNNQVPSKIFDYISYGKPIVNVCKNRECPTLYYLEQYPLCINLYEEKELFDNQKVSLENFVMQNNKKRLSFDFIEERYKTCTPKYCANSFINALKNM